MDSVTPTRVQFLREMVSGCIPDLMPFLETHYQETGSLDEKLSIPSFTQYFDMEKKGFTRFYTVRDDGALIGYCMLFVLIHPHYSESKFAQQDVLFIKKELRGSLSCNFIEWVDRQLSEEGVNYVIRGVSEKNDYSGLLVHLGYKKDSVNYMRRLGL